MASNTSATSRKMELPSTKYEKRLKRLEGAATAEGSEYEWKLSGLLALRAYKYGLQFEVFSNVEATRPCDDVVLRLLGPKNLLPSSVTYFVQLKHRPAKAKEKAVTEQAFTTSNDFNLKKYFEWFHGFYRTPSVLTEDQNILRETERVRLVLFTNNDVMPETRNLFTSDDLRVDHFPFEEIFETREDGESFCFNSNFRKVWGLLDRDYKRKECYQNDFLRNLKFFCKQTSSTEMEKIIENELIEVFGDKAKEFLDPFLSFLRKWSENNRNDFCLFNNTLLDFLGRQLRENVQSSLCGKLKFKPESLSRLRDALRNAVPHLDVIVPEAPEPGLRAVKVLQAVSEEFGEDDWLYVDASILKGFRPQILIDAARRVRVLIIDVEESQEECVRSLVADKGSEVLVRLTAKKRTSRGSGESEYVDKWSLEELNDES